MKRTLSLVVAACLAGACTSGASPSSGSSSPAAATTEPTRAPTPTPTLAPGVLEVFDIGFRPSAILAAGDVIWAEDHARTNKVYAVDPETGKTVATIELRRPCDLALGFDRVWAADIDRGLLTWIDPKTMKLGGKISGLAGPCGPQVIGDSIWAAVNNGVARIDPATSKVTVTELGGAAFPGTGEPIWAVKFGSGELIRIDGATGKAAITIPPPGGTNEGTPTVTAFGSVWVGNSSAGRMYRLDPMTGEIDAEIPNTSPTRMLATEDAVWLTNYPAGVVQRIDPTTNEIAFTAKLGGNMNGITEGFGSIWAADTLAGLLYRIDPAAASGAP